MDLQEMRKNARGKLGGYCRVCPVCDGRACAGEVPGMGGLGTGESFKANLAALASVRLKMRTLHNVKNVSTAFPLWGKQLKFPVLAAPMTGTTYNMGGKLSEEEFTENIVAGAIGSGTLGMIGDGADPTMYDSGIKAIAKHGGQGIAIIKPRSQQEIIKRIRVAEEKGALAVGVDIDGAGLITMALKGQPVGPKSFEEIQELVQATKLPFILKGVMTVEEAELAVKAGIAAIVVSNHGGRVLDYTQGAAEILPAIAKKVKGKITIFTDGGVRSGSDVLKLLALGADAILIGRPLVVGAFGGESQGVSLILDKIYSELIQAMLLTGTADICQVSNTILV